MGIEVLFDVRSPLPEILRLVQLKITKGFTNQYENDLLTTRKFVYVLCYIPISYESAWHCCKYYHSDLTFFLFYLLHLYLSTNKTRPKRIDDNFHEKMLTHQNFKTDYLHHFIDTATRFKWLVRGFKIIQIVFILKSQSHQNIRTIQSKEMFKQYINRNYS